MAFCISASQCQGSWTPCSKDPLQWLLGVQLPRQCFLSSHCLCSEHILSSSELKTLFREIPWATLCGLEKYLSLGQGLREAAWAGQPTVWVCPGRSPGQESLQCIADSNLQGKCTAGIMWVPITQYASVPYVKSVVLCIKPSHIVLGTLNQL